MLLLQLCPLHQTHVSQLVKQGEQSSLYCQFCPQQVKVDSEVKVGQEGEVKQEVKASVAEAVSEGQGKPELNTDFKRKHTAENKLYVLNMFVMGWHIKCSEHIIHIICNEKNIFKNEILEKCVS